MRKSDCAHSVSQMDWQNGEEAEGVSVGGRPPPVEPGAAEKHLLVGLGDELGRGTGPGGEVGGVAWPLTGKDACEE